jgi:hypothetical protein
VSETNPTKEVFIISYMSASCGRIGVGISLSLDESSEKIVVDRVLHASPAFYSGLVAKGDTVLRGALSCYGRFCLFFSLVDYFIDFSQYFQLMVST